MSALLWSEYKGDSKWKHALLLQQMQEGISLLTNTPMASSQIPLNDLLHGLFHYVTSPKGVSGTHLARILDLNIGYGWYMLHRFHAAFSLDDPPIEFSAGGTFEIDETLNGGRSKNLRKLQKLLRKLTGVEHTIILGIYHRESKKIWLVVVPDIKANTIAGIIHQVIPVGSIICCDGGVQYSRIQREMHTVNHSKGIYSRKGRLLSGEEITVTTNGIENVWSILKRSIKGVNHKWPPKHLERHVTGFAGYINLRFLNEIDRMKIMLSKFVGVELTFEKLTIDDGLQSGAGLSGAYHKGRSRKRNME